MQTGPVACALFGLVLVACARSDVATSSGTTSDASGAPDSTSTRTTPAVPGVSLLDGSVPAAQPWDGCVIADAGGLAQDGAYGSPGWTCTIPAQARTSTTCQIMSNQYGGCRPTQYYLSCFEKLDASSLGCTYGGGGIYGSGDAPPVTTYGYCCFCEGTEAATGCVNVDVSSYDRSCTKDSDCTIIEPGMWCPGDCACGGCGGSAVNKDSQACYERTIAPLLPSLDDNCNCPACSSESSAYPGPVCVQGVCTVPNNQ